MGNVSAEGGSYWGGRLGIGLRFSFWGGGGKFIQGDKYYGKKKIRKTHEENQNLRIKTSLQETPSHGIFFQDFSFQGIRFKQSFSKEEKDE